MSTRREILARLVDVSLKRNGSLVLDSISIDLPSSSILALIGPNGAGKTTILEILLGEIIPDSGEVFVCDERLTPKSKNKPCIGYLPQRHLFEQHVPITAEEAVMMPRFRKIGILKKPGDTDRAIVREALAMTGAGHLAKRLLNTLSGGELQKVLIARAIAAESKILLLDEPDAGIDLPSQEAFMELIKKLRDEHGMAIVLASHDIGTVTRHADFIACLSRKLFFHGTPQNLDMSALEKTFGRESQFLIHDTHFRQLEKHDG